MLLAYKNGEWQEIKTFPRMHFESGWEMVDGFVYRDNKWGHAWYNILGSVPVPQLSGTYEYDKTEQTVTISTYDPDFVQVSGETSATEAGTYTVRFHLLNYHYTWDDGTTADKLATWTIKRRALTIPTVKGTYVYNKTTQVVQMNDYDPEYETQTGQTQAKEFGTYHVYYNLKDPINTVWEDYTITQKIVSWTISKGILKKPVLKDSGVYTFDQNEHRANVDFYDPNYINRTGDVNKYNVGDYVTRYDLIDDVNTEWEDGTVTQVVIEWQIIKYRLNIPTVSGTFTYDRTEKSAVISDDYWDFTNYILITSDSEPTAINAGRHSIFFKLSDTANTTWSDGTVSNQQGTWNITKRQLAIPAIIEPKSFEYNTEPHTVSTTYDASAASQSEFNAYISEKGERIAISIGTYTLTWNLKDTMNTSWDDGSQYSQSESWYITKKKIEEPTVSAPIDNIFNTQEKSAIITYAAGTQQYIKIVEADSQLKGTHAGTYTIKFALEHPADTEWKNKGTSSSISLTWTIAQREIDNPSVSSPANNVFTITNGAAKVHNAVISIVSGTGNYITQRSDSVTAASNYGTYHVYYQLNFKDDTYWKSNKRSDDLDFTWNVLKREIELPRITSAKEYTYDHYHGYTITTSYETTYVTEGGDSKTQQNAGTYTVTWDLIYQTNTVWKNTTSTDTRSEKWKINKAEIEIPVVTGSFTFDTTEHAAHMVYDSEYCDYTPASTVRSVASGTFDVYFALTYESNTYWKGGGTGEKKYQWSIAKRVMSKDPQITKPTVGSPYTYTGNNQTAETNINKTEPITGDDKYINETYKETGGLTQKNAGTYTVYWDLGYPTDTTWRNGGASQKTGTWNIQPKSLTKPSLNSGARNLIFKNAAYDIKNYVDNYNDTYEKYDSNVDYATVRTNAGSYTSYVQLRDKANLQWDGGTTDDVKLDWTIQKLRIAAHSMISPSGIEGYNGSAYAKKNQTATVIWTPSAGGAATYGLYSTDIAVDYKVYKYDTISHVYVEADKSNVTMTIAPFANSSGNNVGARFTVTDASIYNVYPSGTIMIYVMFLLTVNVPKDMGENVEWDNDEMQRAYNYIAYPTT